MKDSNEHIRRNALIIGTGALARGLFGLELFKAGYGIKFADFKNDTAAQLDKERKYSVEVNSPDKHKPLTVHIEDLIDLEDVNKLSEETKSTELILTTFGIDQIRRIGTVLGKALYNGYCQIDRHERNTLNIVASDNSYRPAEALRDGIYKTWHELPNGHYLYKLGVSRLRITNSIATRECTSKDHCTIDILASQLWDWNIEDKVWIEMKRGFNYEVIGSHEQLKKSKKKTEHIQFMGKEDFVPGVNFVDNIVYDQLFNGRCNN